MKLKHHSVTLETEVTVDVELKTDVILANGKGSCVDMQIKIEGCWFRADQILGSQELARLYDLVAREVL